jgi:hypothetical protein
VAPDQRKPVPAAEEGLFGIPVGHQQAKGGCNPPSPASPERRRLLANTGGFTRKRLRALDGFAAMRARLDGIAINRAAAHKEGGLLPPYTSCVSQD